MTEKKNERQRFSIDNFVNVVLKRQKKKQSDTFLIIWGGPRTGKTTLGLHFLMRYMKAKRRQYNAGLTPWCPEIRWKDIFKKYFSSGAEDMENKTKNNPEESVDFIDEGNDVASWTHMLEKEQKDLILLLQKTGKRKHFVIWLVPSMKLLTKDILSRAHYLAIIPDEPKAGKNSAYLFRNHMNPIMRENDPFGLKRIIEYVVKNNVDGNDRFKQVLERNNRLICKFSYGSVDERLYALYDKLVKEPLIMKERERRKMVSRSQFERVDYALNTIMFNLNQKDEKTYADVARLLIDKFGTQVIGTASIRPRIDKIAMLQVKPDVKVEEEPEESLEEVHPELDALEQAEDSEEQVDSGKHDVSG